MKKQLIALATMGAVIAGCSSSATAAQIPAPKAIVKTNPDFMSIVMQDAAEQRIAGVVKQLRSVLVAPGMCSAVLHRQVGIAQG